MVCSAGLKPGAIRWVVLAYIFLSLIYFLYPLIFYDLYVSPLVIEVDS
jgi:hypothetical protein